MKRLVCAKRARCVLLARSDLLHHLLRAGLLRGRALGPGHRRQPAGERLGAARLPGRPQHPARHLPGGHKPASGVPHRPRLEGALPLTNMLTCERFSDNPLRPPFTPAAGSTTKGLFGCYEPSLWRDAQPRRV